MAERTNITSPVGRIVAGSLYKPNEKDFDGNPLVYKTGANAGQKRVSYFVALAIPKIPGHTHWAQTDWGSKIWQVGHAAFPQAAQRPDFAWKIEDGDSTIPNKRNRKPCDQEGWPGHWIIKLSNGFAPKVYFQDGSKWVERVDVDAVKPGYFVEVSFSPDGNGNQNNPGVYLNLSMVAFRGYGPEIVFGPNVDDAGFGAAPLPVGASMMPPPSAALPSPGPAAVPNAPYMPPQPPVASAPAIPPVPVVPNPAFVQLPPPGAFLAPPAVDPARAALIAAGLDPTKYGMPATPTVPASGVSVPSPAASVIPVPPATVSPSSPRMTDKASGVSYEAYRQAGWTDAQLVANGLMTI